jgi:Phosphatidylglycerophosphate synthase
MVYLPNIISLFRLFLVPVIVWLIVTREFKLAFFACLVAGLTDALDGYLARRFKWQTDLGSYLDPIADKLLLISLYVTLGVLGDLPAWLSIMVVSRDILIIGAVMLAWLLARPMAMRPIPLSKANTLAQIALALLVLAQSGFTLDWPLLTQTLIWTVGGLTLATAGAYLVMWMKHMAGEGTRHG